MQGWGGKPGAVVGSQGMHKLLTFVQAAAEMPSGGEELETPAMARPQHGKGEKEEGREVGGER